MKIKQIKEFCRSVPRVMAEKSFLSSILFIFIAIIVGGILFYKYDILVDKKEPQASEVSLKLQTKAYSSVMAEWQERQAKFEAADFKNWSDPFFNSASSTLTK